MIITGSSGAGCRKLMQMLNQAAQHVIAVMVDYEALVTIKDLDRPIIMIRDPRDVLCEKTPNGNYVTNGDRSAYGGKGLVKFNKVALQNYTELEFYRYEHLAARPMQTQQRIADYWKVEFKYDFEDFMPKGFMSVGIWKDNRQRIRQQFDAFPELFGQVRALGYEQDDDWYAEVLANTEPQEYQGVPPKMVGVNPKGVKISFKMGTMN